MQKKAKMLTSNLWKNAKTFRILDMFERPPFFIYGTALVPQYGV